MMKLLPPTTKHMSLLEVYVKDRPTVKGFGMPFANRGHPSEQFLNHDASINGHTLVSILERDSFQFIVAVPDEPLERQWTQKLAGPFRYPYGEVHFWDEGLYAELLPATKGPQFARAWTFDNDNEHLAALTQSQVQDIMWVHDAAVEIAATSLRAYFVPTRGGPVEECNFFYVVVPLGKEFMDKYEETWRRLTSSGLLTLNVWDHEAHEDDELAVPWIARIQEVSRGIDVLDCHPSDVNDLILHVRRPRKEDMKRDDIPVKVFTDRRAANMALQKDKEQ